MLCVMPVMPVIIGGMGRCGLTRVSKWSTDAQPLDAHRAHLGDLADARFGAGGLEVEGHEGDRGQVEVCELPTAEGKAIATRIGPAEAAIVAHKDLQDFTGQRAGRRRSQEQPGSLGGAQRLASDQQIVVQPVSYLQRQLQLHADRDFEEICGRFP